MKKERPKLIVILGPTATGKSDLAVKLAKKFNGEIVSADSRQVYKGMDLGSGKIGRNEMRAIPHHLLDISSPRNIFNVEQFKILGRKAILTILEKNKVPIVCGGTGFYIDALLYNTSFPDVPPNRALRKKLASESAEKLFSKLQRIDPRRAKTIDRKNKVRLIRAIEIVKVLGKVPRQTKEEQFESLKIGLDLPDEILKKKISIRLFARISRGMIEEVEKLHKNGVSWKRLESFGLEYRFIAKFLQKRISKEELISLLGREIFQFVRRQRTWFKKDKDIYWFNPKDATKIETLAKQFLSRKK